MVIADSQLEEECVRGKQAYLGQSAVMKPKFGFTKVRYRGLQKNANRLFMTCALVNLFLMCKQLLCSAAR